jgi:hypothetical protein
METQVNETTKAARASGPGAETTLDSLAARTFGELGALYARAPNATTMRAIDGTPKGRMLAARGVDRTPLGPLVRAFAASRAFVWDGKTFASTSDTEGTGINRVVVSGVLGRQNLFPFATHFGPSALDGAPALILDYDLGDNPPYIRKIHDEVRELAPGLFLGPAMWKAASGPTTLLWFALDNRRRG